MTVASPASTSHLNKSTIQSNNQRDILRWRLHGTERFFITYSRQSTPYFLSLFCHAKPQYIVNANNSLCECRTIAEKTIENGRIERKESRMLGKMCLMFCSQLDRGIAVGSCWNFSFHFSWIDVFMLTRQLTWFLFSLSAFQRFASMCFCFAPLLIALMILICTRTRGCRKKNDSSHEKWGSWR